MFHLRIDFRTEIARDEDFVQSAKHSNLDYEELLQQLLRFGIQRAVAPSLMKTESPGESPHRSPATSS
jgi:hypothetical protein